MEGIDDLLAEAEKDLVKRTKELQVPERDEIIFSLLLTAILIDGGVTDAKISAVGTAMNELGLKAVGAFNLQKSLPERLGPPINMVLFAKQHLSVEDRARLFEKVLLVQMTSGARGKDAGLFAGLCKDVFELDEKVAAQITHKVAERLVDDELSRGQPQEGGGKNDLKRGGCFVATAAWSDEDAPEVRALRTFRDDYLLATVAGTLAVRLYYRLSPPLAAWLRQRPRMRKMTRMFLRPILFAAGVPREHGGRQ